MISLSGLAECTLYSLDITPVTAAAAADGGGETLQPGEQYGTIHSTLCAPEEAAAVDGGGDGGRVDGEEWFGEREVAGEFEL